MVVALFAFLSIDICESGIVSPDERQAMLTLAEEQYSGPSKIQDYSVSKCTAAEYLEDDQIVKSTEQLLLRGKVPLRIGTDYYNEADIIYCSRSTTVQSDGTSDTMDECQSERVRYLAHDELNQGPVQLMRGVSVERATAFIDYLVEYTRGTGVVDDYPENVRENFERILSKVSWISAVRRGGTLCYRAGYAAGGDTIIQVESAVISTQPLRFSKVGDIGSQCE